MITYVDLETAKAAKGVRIVATNAVPSPWGEAAKALFAIANVPALCVRSTRGDAAVREWMQTHNVPVVFHDAEPPRSVWSQIVALASRLAGPGVLLPVDLERRVETIGLIHEIAGEDGLGWNARLMMIHASFISDGKRGFPLPVAQYLAAKYGYAPELIEAATAKAIAVLAALAGRLGQAAYFHGDRPGALDAYVATFLTPATHLAPEDCPNLAPALRTAFAAAADELSTHVPASLLALRRRMFEHHLGWPIEI
ncbi:MAG: hypothetical protein JO257_08980 [Deltaproteobacteria bacterium]|nr:hypothetical protein [Deltaproteobacteria bacterium]